MTQALARSPIAILTTTLVFSLQRASGSLLMNHFVYKDMSLHPRVDHVLSPRFNSVGMAACWSEVDDNEKDDDEPQDTVRVRIWQTLVAQKGREISLAQLSSTVEERRGDVRYHLSHVEKQCKTLQSKSNAWRQRRNLPPDDNKVRISTRRGGGKRKELFVKLQ